MAAPQNPYGPQTGLLGLLGLGSNPLYRGLKDGGLLDSLAYGLSSGTSFGDGLKKAAISQIGGRNDREERVAKAAEWDKTQQQAEGFKTWLQSTRPDLLPMLDAGVSPDQIFNQAMKQPEAPNLPNEYEIFQLAQSDPAFAEYLKGPGAAGGDQPASVKEYQFAVSQGYGKDYQTFIQEKGRNAGTPPATIAKEIFEADEGAQAGQNVITALDKALEINATAWDGPLADLSSSTTALLGKKDDPTTLAAVQTQELKNLVTANALESLKATFGAAPTEGERKILLEVQGSINQPRAVREAIFKRAKAAAERRLKFNQERGSALRGGNYFDPGYSPVGGASDPVSAADALLNSGKY